MADEAPETVNQLSRRLKLPTAWVRQEAKAGRLPCLRVGGRFLFSPSAVNQVLVERAAEDATLATGQEASK